MPFFLFLSGWYHWLWNFIMMLIYDNLHLCLLLSPSFAVYPHFAPSYIQFRVKVLHVQNPFFWKWLYKNFNWTRRRLYFQASILHQIREIGFAFQRSGFIIERKILQHFPSKWKVFFLYLRAHSSVLPLRGREKMLLEMRNHEIVSRQNHFLVGFRRVFFKSKDEIRQILYFGYRVLNYSLEFRRNSRKTA